MRSQPGRRSTTVPGTLATARDIVPGSGRDTKAHKMSGCALSSSGTAAADRLPAAGMSRLAPPAEDVAVWRTFLQGLVARGVVGTPAQEPGKAAV